METQNLQIKINEKVAISSAWLIPKDFQAILIIAHGAGNDMHSDFISFLHQIIAGQGIMTVKFNFPYMEQGRKAPDRAPVLIATWQAVIDAVLEKTQFPPKQLFLSGKSMGGRYASMLAAEETAYGGLILYGYPLHPPGKPEKLRVGHLSSIPCPMLFFQGTRDSLCKLDILRENLRYLQPAPELHIIEGGDHSFKVLKRLNRSEQSVWQEIAEHSSQWMLQHV
jgi:uncharacterized protein